MSFWAFELLWMNGELLTGPSYAERRVTLEALGLPGQCGVVPRYAGTDAFDMLAACGERETTRYRLVKPGRHSRSGMGLETR